MVYDIQSTSVNTNSRIAGIQLWYQSNSKIYYNSVYLSGTGGSSPGGSAALFIVSAGTVTNLDVKKNILVNKRNDSPYCASSICDYSSAIFTSDYNDLYYDDTNPDNCLVKIGPNEYLTLANWQAIGKDLHSIAEMPNFVPPYVETDEILPFFVYPLFHVAGGIPDKCRGKNASLSRVNHPFASAFFIA